MIQDRSQLLDGFKAIVERVVKRARCQADDIRAAIVGNDMSFAGAAQLLGAWMGDGNVAASTFAVARRDNRKVVFQTIVGQFDQEFRQTERFRGGRRFPLAK